METTRPYLLLDGTNLVHRSYHGMSSTKLHTSAGEPVWALHGLVGFIAKLIGEHRPSGVLVAFDTKGGCPSRRALAPLYKAGRAETEDALRTQLNAAPQVLAAAGLAVCSVQDWEADDILASGVRVAGEASVMVVSSDKDAHQLISANVRVVKPEGLVLDEAGLVAKYQVHPTRWVEYAALVGEGADNLEGVKGCGPKRAAALLAAFSDVEDAIADPEKTGEVVGRSVARALVEGAETFRRNRTVGALRGDLEVDLGAGVLTRLDARGVYRSLESAGLESAGSRLAGAITRVRS
jgi:5'-3' exonuclease